MKRPKRSTFLLFFIFYAFFFFVCWCSPYTRDDYNFLAVKYNNASQFFTYLFQYGNGRLLGNAFGIIFVRFHVLSCLIRAFVITSIVYLTPYIMGYQKTETYILSFLIFTLCDPALFGEVYLWSSAFYNYISPIFFTLLVLFLIKKFPSCAKYKAFICLSTFLLGTCSQLFIEHSTIVNLLFASIVTGFVIFTRKKDFLYPAGFWLLGTLVGAALMYVIPLIFYVEGNPSENYRGFNSSSVMTLIVSCCKNALKIGNYFSGMSATPICIGAISTNIYIFSKTHNVCKIQQLMLNTSIIISCILLINGFLSGDAWGAELAILKHCIELILILVLVSQWIFASFKIGTRTRYVTILLIVLALASLAPLLVVSPIPKRTIFQSYYFFGTAALLSILELSESLAPTQYAKFKHILITVTISFMFVLTTTFLSVKSMVNVREKHILSEIENGSREIVVFQIPYRYTALDSTWGYDLYYFHEVPGDISFISIEYTQWMNNYYSVL